MTDRFVCFGEVMLRLSPPGRERLLQSGQLMVDVGGAEANVAVALAQFGVPVRFASAVPTAPTGQHALAQIRQLGVDVSLVRTEADGRMGLYFVAPGALMRATEVTYDRADSVFARTANVGFDWSDILKDAEWLHVSGITPAVSEAACEGALVAARTARNMGLRVSFDCNYRSKLWARWQGDAPRILRELMSCATIIFGEHRDIAMVLGEPPVSTDPVESRALAAQMAFAQFPRLQAMASTIRTVESADKNTLQGVMVTRTATHQTRVFTLDGIVDRIGGGDAFAAGVLYGLATELPDAEALDFGVAAACLKHGIPGDFLRADVDEVRALLSDSGLDVKR